MVRTLIASMLMCTSMAVACPQTGCSDAKSETAPAVLSVSAPAEKSGGCCPLTAAATMAVSAPAEKSGDCASACTGAATMAVSGPAEKSGDCASACSGAATMAVAGEPASCASACSGDAAKSGTSFASYVPKMSYKVGDTTTACSKSAGAMAAEQHADMHFVVAGVEYADQAEAMTAHAKQLESMMMDLVRIQYAVDGECVACPTAAKEMASCDSKNLQYKVGPATFDSAEAAIQASIMAYNAARNVKMEYAVGEKTTACSVEAGKMAKSADCSVEYVVNGQRTGCSKSASYMKTLASVESALKALEAASKAPVATAGA